MTADFPKDLKTYPGKEIPPARLGTPEYVAEPPAFLAWKGDAYITGKFIRVTGGLYM